MHTCLRCGSSDVHEVKLAYGADFRESEEGDVPKTGDTLHVCGHCQAFTVEKPKPAAKAKAKPARKRKPKPKAKAAAKA